RNVTGVQTCALPIFPLVTGGSGDATETFLTDPAVGAPDRTGLCARSRDRAGGHLGDQWVLTPLTGQNAWYHSTGTPDSNRSAPRSEERRVGKGGRTR